MSKFYSLHFNVHELDRPGAEAVPRGLAWAIDTLEPGLEQKKLRASVQVNDETAARRYIESLLEDHEEWALRSLVAPEAPAVMPDLRLEGSSESPLTRTRLVKFSQTNRSIPIFGTRAVVEIDSANRSLVAMDADLADVPDVSPLASISPTKALEAIARLCGVSLESLRAVSGPETNFFHHPDQGGSWRLVYHFTDVPATPPEAREDKSMKGCVGAPCIGFAAYDFLVDANTAEIVFSFATHAGITDIPVPCSGVDELGVDRDFFGRNSGTGFELNDPMRAVKTFDYQFDDISNQTWPPHPVQHAAANFGTGCTAAVSAHCNAQLVFDFYNDVLKRKSVDDKGMAVVSMINCTYAATEPPPNWHNAVWYGGRMWYGQFKSGAKFESYSRYLDVIGHELTHGVTESTSKLVYKDQSGALNESFSDIFGIMINNWFPNQPNSVGSWNWEIGPDLGANGLPLRDMSNPKRTNDPDHMNDYLDTTKDNGGVHTNSNIHNKAAYNLLTSKAGSAYVFTPVELAILYYLTLCRLGSMAGFSDCLRTLKSVAAIYYSGNPAVRNARISAIESAYDAVGII